MNCKELVYLLGDYFDGGMEPHLKEEFEAHLEKCEPCLNFLRTYDRTRIICRQLQPEEIPEEVQLRLRAFVLQKAREHFENVEKYFRLAADERRRQAATLVRAYRDGQLAPDVAELLETHRDRCRQCGAFLQAADGEDETWSLPPEFEDHIAEFLETLPRGESPIRR
jgi:anti-sigma factor RsiW